MHNKLTPIPMVDLQAEVSSLRSQLLAGLTDVLDSGEYVLGKQGRKLEEGASDYLNTAYSLGVANGTDALVLSLKALDIGHGDEVITTPFTFIATAEAIAHVGATPVFVDIDDTTYNLDPKKLTAAITAKTKAIIIVHLFGQAANLDDILQITKANRIPTIEDACQAFGTVYKGKQAGSIGDIGCFSFFPSKNLGGFGDGGLVTTNNKNLYDKINILRNHGSTAQYKHAVIGYNSRLDEMQATILLVKLKYLDAYVNQRMAIAQRYTTSLRQFVQTPVTPKGRQHTFHQYCIELDQRDELRETLKNNGIASAIYYPIPLHLQQAFKYLGYKKGDFPIAERVAKRIIALPISPMLSTEKQQHIIATVKQFLIS